MTPRFSLLALIGCTTYAALTMAALVQPSAEWTSIIVSVNVVIFTWQVLRALFTTGAERAACRGWLLFAVSYLAVALGPWLSSHFAPQLISSKMLVYAQVHWRKDSQANPNAQYYNVLTDYNLNGVFNGTSNTIWLNSGWGGTGAPVVNDPVPSAHFFQLCWHWQFAWVFGVIGSIIAAQLYRWGEAKTKR